MMQRTTAHERTVKGSVRSTRERILYTIGYQGRTLPAMIELLAEHKVQLVVDVREAARSRVKGFNLTQLFEGLRRDGIAYEHLRDLGNPREIRDLFHDGELEEGRLRFRDLLEDGRAPAVEVLIEHARSQRTAILCRERDHGDCHRAVVAEVAADRGGLQIKHL